jgi:hypothetical protein
MEESFTIECENGSGEAYRSHRDAPWVVQLPTACFMQKATFANIQKSIKRQARKGREGKVISFGPLTKKEN